MTKRILLVEDSKVSRMRLGHLLYELRPSWEFVEASNPVMALENVRIENMDCIISDITMPEMDGVEFGRRVRETGNTVPLFFVTANIQEAMRKQVEELGAVMLEKPITSNKLELIIERLET